MRTDVFGWFENASEITSHDPGRKGVCAVCAIQIGQGKVKTISLIPDAIKIRSYFFRTHSNCWNSISEDERCLIESSLIDEIIKNHTEDSLEMVHPKFNESNP